MDSTGGRPGVEGLPTVAPAGAEAGGKSELRRAVRRVTPGQGDLKESGTENIPPTFAPPALRWAGPVRELALRSSRDRKVQRA